MAQVKMNVVVELVGANGVRQRRQIAMVERMVEGARFGDLGLSLEESKAIQRRLQKELTQFQVDQASHHDRTCHDCNRLHGIHDYRSRAVHSLFGICRLRVPRFRDCVCGQTPGSGSSIMTLLNGRATPELERVQAELGSRLSFREAARVLDLIIPAARPHNHRTVVNRLAKVADQIEKWDDASPYRMSRAGGSSISVFIDGAYIRAVPGYQSRYFEIAMDALLHRGGRRVSSRPHRIWPPASTMRFVPQCGRKDGCLAATSLFSATVMSGCKASCSVQQGSP